jgi:hypothetical protein
VVVLMTRTELEHVSDTADEQKPVVGEEGEGTGAGESGGAGVELQCTPRKALLSSYPPLPRLGRPPLG